MRCPKCGEECKPVLHRIDPTGEKYTLYACKNCKETFWVRDET